MYKEGFASKLKAAREERELNQIDVAVALNIPRSTLANYETGRTEPDIETIGKLITFYQIDANWLLSTTGGKSA
ncbi:MAG: helix-turn-helix domain-containing protein [Oscillospiraceae bacterium]|nr:helix-turn-helix domain-containing protein [Oscillospiraceae bacterium]